MWSPSLASMGKVVVAGVLLTATTNVEACLFPCFWGWGGGYAPPPMYAAPMYGGPAYAPSPCGPGGCSPCGPGGCSSYYGPQACCAPCGTGCSPCGPGGCANGACGANYSSDMTPQPDNRPTPRTYTGESPSGQTSTSGMPDDDFEATQHGADGPDTENDPFKKPNQGAGAGAAPANTDAPMPGGAAEPMPESILPQEMGLQVSPLRMRTLARAQYRIPRVARFDVTPEPARFSIAESRLARR
ncbi:MAG: hypothetical protein JNG89_21505 [Planctomycetaceae bacterium]|nr:hypothetical protein [Planctomycetaceae bacterium]